MTNSSGEMPSQGFHHPAAGLQLTVESRKRVSLESSSSIFWTLYLLDQ